MIENILTGGQSHQPFRLVPRDGIERELSCLRNNFSDLQRKNCWTKFLWEFLRPTVLSQDEIRLIKQTATLVEEIFERIIRHAYGLSKISFCSESTILCREIHQDLEEILSITKLAVTHFEKLQNRQCNRLVELEKKRTAMENSLEEREREIQGQREHKAYMTAKNDDLKRILESVSHERDCAIEQVEKANREFKDALKDSLIPFHGIICAITTGKAERALPLHSQIRAIKCGVEALSNRLQEEVRQKEEELQALENEHSIVEGKIYAIENEITELHQQIQQIHEERSSLDDSVKFMGQQITGLSNLLKNVENLVTRHRFLQVDTKNIQDLLENEIYDQSTINQFKKDLLETRPQFSQILRRYEISQ